MTEDNVMEFCQWLVSEKGIEAGNLSDYINNNEEEVLKLAQEFKKPKFKVGGKVEAAAEKFKCGGKTEEKQDGGKMDRKEYKANKTSRKDLKNAANDRGYSDDQFSKSYYTLKDSFRNNGLSRRNAKLAAQRVIMGDNTAATPVDVAPTEPIYSYSRPSAPTYSWEPDKFYEGFDDMQFEITPVRRKAAAKSAVTKRDPLVFSEIVTPSMNNTNSFASFINPLNNKIYLRNNSVPSDIIDGGVMEDIIVTAPGIVDGGMMDEIVVTAPGKSSKKPKFRTSTMPGRFGLAHYQGGGQVYKNLRLPKESLELIVDKGDSIVMRTPNPANGSYTYIKRKGDQNWSGNMQNSMGAFEEFKKEQANAEARRIVNMFKKPAKFDDGGEVNPDGVIKQYINFGPEYKRFEDNTGRYERVATTKQDTVWRFNDYTTDKAVYTTPKGYVGRFEDIYGGYRDLTPEEIVAVRKSVESRMQNVPQNKSLQDRYRMETFMPENWKKLNK